MTYWKVKISETGEIKEFERKEDALESLRTAGFTFQEDLTATLTCITEQEESWWTEYHSGKVGKST